MLGLHQKYLLVLVYRLIPHAKLKAFDISKNTPQTSRVGSALKAVYISWTIDSNWYVHESWIMISLKLDLCSESNLWSSRYSKKDLKVGFSNIFPNTGNSEIGL